MDIELVVTRRFAGYQPGDRITDSEQITKIRESSNHANVVAVAVHDPVRIGAGEKMAASPHGAVKLIIQQGSVNISGLTVPNLYVQVIPPPQLNINGVPSNILGIVGTASWGPVNSPVAAGSLNQAQPIFGPLQPRKYDLLTQLATAQQQGANNFRLVRVTDGSDVAASVAVQGGDLTITSKYSGSAGNTASVALAQGTKVGTWKVVVGMPGLQPETFDNIGSGLAGAPLWSAIAAAINNGTSSVRGPSNLIVASAGTGADAPAAATFTLAGGTDGATTINGTVLLGTDGSPRKGMYALRGTKASHCVLADCDDSSTWASQVAYGLSEGTYMIGTFPSGETIANAVTVKSGAGIDSYEMKLMHGDWVYWNDTYNDQIRLVSPQGFVAGWLAANGPHLSSLNKPLQGIVGTQTTAANQQYDPNADLQRLVAAGIDVITNPSVGGDYFSCRIGHNTSSDPARNGDNYTRMINYIATTLNAAVGTFVGELTTPDEEQEAEATIGHWLDGLWRAKMIGNSDGSVPYAVEIDAANNPESSTALGFQIGQVLVQFLPVNEKFLINVIGGQTVQILKPGQAAA